MTSTLGIHCRATFLHCLVGYIEIPGHLVSDEMTNFIVCCHSSELNM